jgi:hypothetical protein
MRDGIGLNYNNKNTLQNQDQNVENRPDCVANESNSHTGMIVSTTKSISCGKQTGQGNPGLVRGQFPDCQI